MKTSFQAALERFSKIDEVDKNFIPPITDPLGKHWEQPDVSKFILDDKSALMSQEGFDCLLDYSNSQPSGVYPGKCWKAKYGEKWFLCWFGHDTKPNHCSNNYREILIA